MNLRELTRKLEDADDQYQDIAGESIFKFDMVFVDRDDNEHKFGTIEINAHKRQIVVKEEQ